MLVLSITTNMKFERTPLTAEADSRPTSNTITVNRLIGAKVGSAMRLPIFAAMTLPPLEREHAGAYSYHRRGLPVPHCLCPGGAM